MKKLILLLALPLTIFCQINKAVSESPKAEHNFLIDKEVALKHKDSLVSLGWSFQEKFPFFYKTTATGKAPKSCAFSPNDSIVSVTLLSEYETAVQFFRTHSIQKIKTLHPSYHTKDRNKGYAEGIWKNDNEFWFTRMTTGDFFIWHKNNDSIEQYDSKGRWTKIIEMNPSQNLVAMSHWSSDDVTVFEVNTKNFVRRIKTGETPRGIVWLNDSVFVTALFEDGDVEVFNINNGKKIHHIKGYGGAARDLQYDEENKIIYYSNMGVAKIFKYDWIKKKYLGEIKVDYKPNTIRLSADNKYLFVSCRGPNNPKGYTRRSPRDGDIFIIDAEKLETIVKWRAGNQPTGLDVSSCGTMLAQTDFLDNKLTIWLVALPEYTSLKNRLDIKGGGKKFHF